VIAASAASRSKTATHCMILQDYFPLDELKTS
jgi:hypothetical protein